MKMPVDQYLAAAVVRNGRVQVRQVGGGRVELSLPYRKPWILRALSRKKTFLRRFELDETGSDLWRQIDDRRTVRDLVTYLESHGTAAGQQATESAVAYVHMLLVRGLVGLVVPEGT